ncbi:hypothetical protein [Maridesulfovibrio sp.]|uniref:hypothetical protein n=1 Tax=Maridesulfovibrio sp. TaxID=2795000 RepID=UPI002AA72C10|nr:hypothetical protein [Maridesulfovibrio sp.]
MRSFLELIDKKEDIAKDIFPIFMLYTAIGVSFLSIGEEIFFGWFIRIAMLVAIFICYAIVIIRNHKKISDLENELEVLSSTKKFILSELHDAQQNTKENTVEDLEQTLVLKEKIKSLETQLAEQEDIISKNKWKKWFIPACTAMGDIIRENTVNSSHPIIIEKEQFFTRVISHYPNFNEIKNVKGEPFGSALRESWRCVPVTVKDMTGGSGRGKKASK